MSDQANECDDLTARARKRAEELDKKRAAATDGQWFRYYSITNGNTVKVPSGWVFVASAHGTKEDCEFVAYAANTANENADLLTALADRVDEQERRIGELEVFKEAVYRVCVEEGVKHHSRAKILAEFQDALDEALSQKGGE